MTTNTNLTLKEMNPYIGGFYVDNDKFYLPQGNEVTLELSEFATGVPLLIDGPTGVGKSSLAHHLCYRLGKGWKEEPKLKPEINKKIREMIEDSGFHETGYPMFTIQGQDDLTADDLRGRPYIVGGETLFLNGMARLAARHGGMLYFDEPAEARPDTLVVTHSLTDHRRVLEIEKLGLSERLQQTTFPVLTYNSSYQDPRKRFKPSTAQRFIHLYLGYPDQKKEMKIIEGALKEDDIEMTPDLKRYVELFILLARESRSLAQTETKLQEGASPRVVILAAKLASTTNDKNALKEIALGAFCYDLSTDPEMRKTLEGLVSNKF